MQLELIKKENVIRYEHLIPVDLHNHIEMENAFALGAYDEKDNYGAGILLSSEEEGWFRINLLMVDRAYEETGITKLLLKELIEVLDQVPGIIGIRAFYNIDTSTAVLKNVLEEYGFQTTMEEESIYKLPLGKIAESAYFQKVLNRKNINKLKTRRLSSVSTEERKYISNLFYQMKTGVAIPLPVKWEEYDEDVSILFYEGDKNWGILLFKVWKNCLELSYMSVNSSNVWIIPEMLLRAERAAIEKFPADMEVFMALIDDKAEKLVNKLFPEVDKQKSYMSTYRYI